MQLNEGQKEIGRRNFLKAVAALPAVGAFAYTAAQAGPVKIGIIGTGMEGRILIQAMDPKYTYIVAMSDIRPDNQAIGKWWLGQCGHSPDPRVYEDYHDLLNDPEVEAVVIATPLHMHAPMAIDAMKAGKHAFTEKTMAFTVEDCQNMVKTSQETGKNLQVGHQRFYNPLYWDAYRMIHEGLIGNVYHIRALWHRNTDWNYWTFVEDKHYENLLKFDPSKWGYKDPQHMVNWRWYSDTSHGMWTELASHQIAITNWFFGDIAPTAVVASSGKYKTIEDQMRLSSYNQWKEGDERDRKRTYKEDDRNIADHIYAIYEYPGGRTVTYSAIQSNSYDNYYEEIMGTFGTIILKNENESYLFWEPGWDEASAKKAAEGQKSTGVAVTQEAKTGSAFAAHVSGEATGGGGASTMSPTEPYKWELMGFADTIRRGAPNLCNGVRGLLAAQACYAGQEAAETQKRIEIPKIV